MNPKLKMKAEIEAKCRQRFEKELKEAKEEFARLLGLEHANYQTKLWMGLQMAHDAAIFAIDDVFDVNEYSAKKFHEAHIMYVNKMADMVVVEDSDDPNLEWTKDTVDRRLIQIVGRDNFVPWDERMGGAQLENISGRIGCCSELFRLGHCHRVRPMQRTQAGRCSDPFDIHFPAAGTDCIGGGVNAQTRKN